MLPEHNINTTKTNFEDEFIETSPFKPDDNLVTSVSEWITKNGSTPCEDETFLRQIKNGSSVISHTSSRMSPQNNSLYYENTKHFHNQTITDENPGGSYGNHIQVPTYLLRQKQQKYNEESSDSVTHISSSANNNHNSFCSFDDSESDPNYIPSKRNTDKVMKC